MNRCDIIIPVWNEKELTEKCLKSIVENTFYPHRIIVIDNGSKAETKEFLESYKKISGDNFIIIRNDENLGFVKAMNQGLRKADASYVCLLNNDTVVYRNWLSNMVTVSETVKNAGIVNPSSNIFGEAYDENKDNTVDPAYTYMDTCRGFCMLIKAQTLKKVGMLDEDYGFGYFEEADFCKRALKEGFLCVKADSAYVYHHVKASFKKIKNTDEIFENNRVKYHTKWGKPVWVGFLAGDNKDIERIKSAVNYMLHKGHRVLLLKRKEADIGGFNHINIKTVKFSVFFPYSAVLKVALRKKDKRVFALSVPSSLYRTVKGLNIIHRANIFRYNDIEKLKKTVNDLSFDKAYIT